VADRPLLRRIHNPRNRECGCSPECWCRRTAVGRLVKWWFRARWFGIHHRSSYFDGMTPNEIREWKRAQAEKNLHPMVVQPRYEAILRLGPARWAFVARTPDGERVVRAIGPLRLDPS